MKEKAKMGRNQPCWCGSGAKHKKCHLDREKEEELKPWELKQKFMEAFSRKSCLHPHAGNAKCKGGIIKAHSIQKSGVLSKISEQGHVYTRKINMEGPQEERGQPIVKKIGITQASTFNGFCQHHDNEIFKEIETQPFLWNSRQIFLYGYRALCRDVFTKRAGKEFFQGDFRNIDKGKDLVAQQSIQGWLSKHEIGLEVGSNDTEKDKDLYDKELLKGKFVNLNFYGLKTKTTPEVVASFSFIPEYDFQGKFLQDLGEMGKPIESMTLSIFPTEEGGAIIFTWIAQFNGACENFLESLENIPDNKKPDAVVRCAFEFGENTFFSPIWWKNLKEDIQSKLLMRLLSGIATIDRNQNCLSDYEGHLVDWEISSKKTSA